MFEHRSTFMATSLVPVNVIFDNERESLLERKF